MCVYACVRQRQRAHARVRVGEGALTTRNAYTRTHSYATTNHQLEHYRTKIWQKQVPGNKQAIKAARLKGLKWVLQQPEVSTNDGTLEAVGHNL